tara:strand:- start:29574 stop:30938 length:1365 start_codon:yes stop_codon:yes gene_type:complete
VVKPQDDDIKLTSFVAFLEYTVVNTALPTIQTVFHVSVLNLQWVMDIYYLVISVSMVIFGRIGDIYGRRLVFYIGIALLLLASIGAGFSQHFGWLIFFRGMQALGVSAVITLAVSIIYVVFTDRVNLAMGVYGLVTSLGLAFGPTIGGYLVAHYSWPWVFFINVPFLIIGWLCCLVSLPESRAETKTPLDLGGVCLLIVTLGSLIYGVIHGGEHGWMAWSTCIWFIIFVVALPILVIYESKQALPIMNLRFFKKPLFSLAALCCGLSGCLITTALFFDPLFLETVQHHSPKISGLILLALPVGIVLFIPLIHQLLKIMQLQTLFVLSFLFLMIAACLHSLFQADVSTVVIVIALLFIGLTWAVCNIVTPVAAQNAVGAEQSGLAVGTVYTMFNIFSAITLAIAVVVYHHLFDANQHLGYTAAFLSGFKMVFILLAVVTLIITLIGAVLRKKVTS